MLALANLGLGILDVNALDIRSYKHIHGDAIPDAVLDFGWFVVAFSDELSDRAGGTQCQGGASVQRLGRRSKVEGALFSHVQPPLQDFVLAPGGLLTVDRAPPSIMGS